MSNQIHCICTMMHLSSVKARCDTEKRNLNAKNTTLGTGQMIYEGNVERAAVRRF